MVCYGLGRCQICARKHKLTIFGSEKNQHDLIEKVHLQLIVLNTVCMDCIRKFEQIVKKNASTLTLRNSNGHSQQSDCYRPDVDAVEIAEVVNSDEARPAMQFYVEIDGELPARMHSPRETSRLEARRNFAAITEIITKRNRNPQINAELALRDSTALSDMSEKITKIRAKRKIQCQLCCDFCTKEFIHSGDLKRHKRMHTGEKPYECPECHKTFSQLSNLTRHRLVHSGKKPFVCAACGQSYSRKGRLSDHIRRELCKRKRRQITRFS